jgi:hypothetical protein
MTPMGPIALDFTDKPIVAMKPITRYGNNPIGYSDNQLLDVEIT